MGRFAEIHNKNVDMMNSLLYGAQDFCMIGKKYEVVGFIRTINWVFKMRIALCAAQVPFVRGGAEDHCDNIYKELYKSKLWVEYIKIPFKWYPPQEINQQLSGLEVAGSVREQWRKN